MILARVAALAAPSAAAVADRKVRRVLVKGPLLPRAGQAGVAANNIQGQPQAALAHTAEPLQASFAAKLGRGTGDGGLGRRSERAVEAQAQRHDSSQAGVLGLPA